MDSKRETSSDVSSINEDFIEIDAKEDAAEMTDNEMQVELDVIRRFEESLSKKNMASVETLGNTPLATPKIQSVVVIPEPASRYPIAAKSPDGTKLKKPYKASNSNSNRIGLVKNKAKKSDGLSSPIMASFLKGNTSVSENAPKQIIKPMEEDSVVTPVSSKRIRSAGTSPDEVHNQPDKLAKLQNGSERITPKKAASLSLVQQRTLNLKLCASNRPLTGKEMQIVKKFLIYQIEQALEHQSKHIPIFTEPCKIGQDGVYVYCADQACAQWVTYIAKTGIPEISDTLVTLPHTTPVQLNPDFISVRVVTTIPTRKPKDKILQHMAQLNEDLNTEKWGIRKIRPKGSNSSTVYMHMDKRSFDTITAKDEKNRINWILGPIEIRREEHKPRPNKIHPASTMGESKAAGHHQPTESHFRPPSAGSVEGTPRSTSLTINGNGGSKPKILPPKPQLLHKKKEKKE